MKSSKAGPSEDQKLETILETIRVDRDNLYLLYEAVEAMVFSRETLLPYIPDLPKGVKRQQTLLTAYAMKALKHVRLKRNEFIRRKIKLLKGWKANGKR